MTPTSSSFIACAALITDSPGGIERTPRVITSDTSAMNTSVIAT
jgi:hypothetical protein